MNKKQSIILAVIGAGLVAATGAQAQVNYNDNDLLLNFRNSSTDSGNDVEVDLGNVSSFVSAVAALPNETAVLDSGANYNTSSYAPQFSGSTLISTVGGSSQTTAAEIGFSAAAENVNGSGNAANTLWLTRQITTSQLQSGGTPSVQAGNQPQDATANDIENIGGEAGSPANFGTGTEFSGSVNGGVVSDNDPESYHSLAKSIGSPDVINYGNTVAGTGANPLEATPSAGTVYEALWETPAAGEGADTYLGYFTFYQDGEVDFSEVSAVPEPSTYAVFAATGLLVVALRRQFRSLIA